MLYVKSLLKKLTEKAGRNSTGRITCRHRGGRVTKKYFLPNFRRRLYNVLGQIIKIKKESVRTAFIALIFYRKFGVYEYVLAPHNVKIGSFVFATKDEISNTAYVWFKYQKYLKNLGNSFFLKYFKIGSTVFNIEKFPGSGGILMRAAGCSAKIIQKISLGFSKIYVALRLKSKKIFYLKGECSGVLGQVSNFQHNKISRKKAGVARNQGFRPSVRGVAMNPVDHPHGGGEGKTSGGRISVSAWGKLTKGKKTLSKYKKFKLEKQIKKLRFGKSLK